MNDVTAQRDGGAMSIWYFNQPKESSKKLISGFKRKNLIKLLFGGFQEKMLISESFDRFSFSQKQKQFGS